MPAFFFPDIQNSFRTCLLQLLFAAFARLKFAFRERGRLLFSPDSPSSIITQLQHAPGPCEISILSLLIALPHPQHLPSTTRQVQPRSQQEDSIIHGLKCLQAPKLRFSQAISAVVCLGFDASFNTSQTGLVTAELCPLSALGPFGVSGWAIRTGGIFWSVSSWIKSSGWELVKWFVSVNALDGSRINELSLTPPCPFTIPFCVCVRAGLLYDPLCFHGT